MGRRSAMSDLLSKLRISHRETKIKVFEFDSVSEDENDCLSSSLSSISTSKSVRFGECHVRSYLQVLGDHPCCSIGCPLQLGWEYKVQGSMTVDDYEACRKRRRIHDIRLTPEERRLILMSDSAVSEHIYSGEELRKACRRLSQSRHGRKARRRALQKEFFASVER